MWGILKRAYIFSFFLVLSLFQILVLDTNQVCAIPNELIDVQLTVRVLDINIKEKQANLTIRVNIPNFPYNETDVFVQIIGGGDVTLQCNNAGKNNVGWFFYGEANQPFWLLTGSGEVFPFDSYTLRFKVEDLTYFGKNVTLLSKKQDAYFFGQRAYKLRDSWRSNDFTIPLEYTMANEVGFTIEKSLDAKIITAVQLLAPILACYYLLGATLILNPRENLSSRLRIYLSLFVFSSSFFITIQGSLPYHSSLTFPEFLLVNLTISTAIYSIFSMIGSKPKLPWEFKEKVGFLSKWDRRGWMLALIILLILYLTILIGKLNITASLVFSYFMLPSYMYAFFFNLPKENLIKNKKSILIFLLIIFYPLVLLIILQIISAIT